MCVCVCVCVCVSRPSPQKQRKRRYREGTGRDYTRPSSNQLKRQLTWNVETTPQTIFEIPCTAPCLTLPPFEVAVPTQVLPAPTPNNSFRSQCPLVATLDSGQTTRSLVRLSHGSPGPSTDPLAKYTLLQLERLRQRRLQQQVDGTSDCRTGRVTGYPSNGASP